MLSRRILSSFVFGLSLATCIQALAVIVPLYWNPDSNCAAWDSFFEIITAHPNTVFYTIINPDQGPGVAGSQPRSGYQACVSSLRPINTNALVGTVLADIDTYAGWETTYRPTGIFLDNVTATADDVDTYSAYVSHAKSQGFTFTVLNAGGSADAAYFPLVDLINTYDSAYSSFDPTALSNTDSTPLSKQSAMLFDASPSTSDTSLLNQLGNLGVAAVYITNRTTTGGSLPSKFSTFVDDVTSVRQAVSSHSSKSGGSSTGSLSSTGSSTSSASTTSSTSSPSSDKSKSKTVAAVVGGVLGGLILILGLLLIMLCRRRRNHHKSLPPTEMTPFQMNVDTSRGTTSVSMSSPGISGIGLPSSPRSMVSAKRAGTAMMSAATASPSAGLHSTPTPSGPYTPPATLHSSALSDTQGGSQDWEFRRDSVNPPPYYSDDRSE
ncbi:Spherulation-specific family 4-domain-containing protein [Mycena leptocephala]|nr:Spherulation-specific family 4-domain-containing protein [Mycena leptocephala]